MATPETELAGLKIWPAEAVDAFAKHWLTSAQQVVALAATPNGKKSIESLTGLSRAAVDRHLTMTRFHLSEDELRDLDTPVDTRDYGLGAAEPGQDA